MDPTFIEHARKKLLSKKEKLEKSLKAFTHASSHQVDGRETTFPEYGDKDEDNASEVAVFGDELSVERNFEKNIAKIEKALKKIEKGEYGKCEKCGKEISQDRLKIMLAAETCMDCKSK